MSVLSYNYIPDSEENRPTHIWTLVGPLGAVHIWAAPQPETPFKTGEFYGGIECHHPNPLGDSDQKEAPIPVCWLTGKPCWPEGSSLAFEERIEPVLGCSPRPFPQYIHEFVKSELHRWYRDQFETASEAAE